MAFFRVVACLIVIAWGTVFASYQPGQTLLPGGNLRTVDRDGPYDFHLLPQQANELKAGIAARGNFTDKDIVDFLVNVECLEGLFDTWGAFGRGFAGNLELGGPKPIGARKANLTYETEMFLQEVALNEQAHALFTRQAGGTNPCPLIDFDGGFNAWMAAAYELEDETVEEHFGEAFDPFKNDQNFVLSVLALEELGATGNKGLVGLITSPVLSNGVAGLATSATAQATVERMVLWKLKDKIVEPFNETVEQVFARVSALRDSLDGPQLDDQGLTNTDPRFIAVPHSYVNMVPTDVRGLTFSRTPQMNLNIIFLGDESGKGTFFPEGIYGRINSPKGYDNLATGLEDVPKCARLAVQETEEQVGEISEPLTGASPASVPGMDVLTQAFGGARITPGPENRGLYRTSRMSGESVAKEDAKLELPKPQGELVPQELISGTCKREHMRRGGTEQRRRALI